MAILSNVAGKYNSSEKQTSTLPSATINQTTASAPIYYKDHIKMNKPANLAVTNITNQLENYEIKVKSSIKGKADPEVNAGLLYNVLKRIAKPNCVPFIISRKQLLDKFIKEYFFDGFASMVFSFDTNNIFSIDNAEVTYIDVPTEITLGAINTNNTDNNIQSFQLSNLDIKLSKLNNQPIRFVNTSRKMLASEVVNDDTLFKEYNLKEKPKVINEINDEFYLYNPFDPVNVERRKNITGTDAMSNYIREEMGKVKILFYVSNPDKDLYSQILAQERTNSKAQQREVDIKSFNHDSKWGYQQTMQWILSNNTNNVPLPTMSPSYRNDLAFYTNCVSPFFAIINTILASNEFHSSSRRTANTNGMPNTILSVEPIPNIQSSVNIDTLDNVTKEYVKSIVNTFNNTSENTTPIAGAYIDGHTFKGLQIPSTLTQQDRNETIKQLDEAILVFTGTTSANSLSQKAQYSNNATQYNTENFERTQGKIQVILLDPLTNLCKAVGGKKYDDQLITLDSSKYGPTVKNNIETISKLLQVQAISRGDAKEMLKSQSDAIEMLDLIKEPTTEDFETYTGQRNVNSLPTQNNKTLLSGNT